MYVEIRNKKHIFEALKPTLDLYLNSVKTDPKQSLRAFRYAVLPLMLSDLLFHNAYVIAS